MANKGLWRASGVALDVIGTGLTLWWAAMLIIPGLALVCMDDEHARMGGITLIVSGVIVLVRGYIFDLFVSLCGRVADAAKEKIAPKPLDPNAEPEISFDAEAALERYLAQKRAPEARTPAVPESVRPVFGRRAPPKPE
jgi:hypothetical protein